MVENACKWLVQQRFKGVGMRWSETGFNHLLHLRPAWVNGTFASLFEPVETAIRRLNAVSQEAPPTERCARRSHVIMSQGFDNNHVSQALGEG